MSRASDIAAIVRALDRAADSDAWHRDAKYGGMVGVVASMILELGNHGERFEGDKWTSAGIRAATIAYATNAPDNILYALAYWARREYRWVEWWDNEGWLESEGCIPLQWRDERGVERRRAA